MSRCDRGRSDAEGRTRVGRGSSVLAACSAQRRGWPSSCRGPPQGGPATAGGSLRRPFPGLTLVASARRRLLHPVQLLPGNGFVQRRLFHSRAKAVTGAVQNGERGAGVALDHLPRVAVAAEVVLAAEKEESGLLEGLGEAGDVEREGIALRQASDELGVGDDDAWEDAPLSRLQELLSLDGGRLPERCGPPPAARRRSRSAPRRARAGQAGRASARAPCWGRQAGGRPSGRRVGERGPAPGVPR